MNIIQSAEQLSQVIKGGNGNGHESEDMKKDKALETLRLKASQSVERAQRIAAAINDEASKLEAEQELLSLAVGIKEARAYLEEKREVVRAAEKSFATSKALTLTPLEQQRDAINLGLAKYHRICQQRYFLEQAKKETEQKKQQERITEKIVQQKLRAGDPKGAQEAIKEAERTPAIAPVIIQKETTTKGVIYQNKWEGHVVDLMKIVRAIARPKGAPLELLFGENLKVCNHIQSNINSFSRAHKGVIKVDGIEFRIGTVVKPRPDLNEKNQGEAA